MVCAIQRLKCVCVRISTCTGVRVTRTHARAYIYIHTFIVYLSACVVARCQIDAVCRCSKPQSARLYRDDPNTRALSSSHYGYVLSAGVFSLWVPGNVVLGEGWERGTGWFPRGGWQVGWFTIEVLLHNGIVLQGDKPIGCFDAELSWNVIKRRYIFTASHNGRRWWEKGGRARGGGEEG